MAARNPSIAIDIPAAHVATLDALATRRGVSRAVVARTALADALGIPDTITSSHRRGRKGAPPTGPVLVLPVTIDPAMRDALNARAARDNTSRAQLTLTILLDYLASHPVDDEPAAQPRSAANPSMVLHIPDDDALALDALATRRGVSRAVVARTALADALGIPDTITSSHRRGRKGAPPTGPVLVLPVTIDPAMRDALNARAARDNTTPYGLAVTLIGAYLAAHPVTDEPANRPTPTTDATRVRVFTLPADLNWDLTLYASAHDVPKAVIVRTALRHHLNVTGPDPVSIRSGSPMGPAAQEKRSIQVSLDPDTDTALRRAPGPMTVTVETALRQWLADPNTTATDRTLPTLDLGPTPARRGATLTDDAESLIAGWTRSHPSHTVSSLLGHTLAIAAGQEETPAALDGFGDHVMRTPGQEHFFPLPAPVDQWLTDQQKARPDATLGQIVSDAVMATAARLRGDEK